MKIIPICVGDILELKKSHPCGEKRFRVLRTGSEVHISCLGCGHDMTLERIKLEKAIKSVTHTDSTPHT
ncbi:MAG: DUF951 domain-containing protein [Clostridia bacterium]|nr:DUF951 domain-containing protein [Clostridia bacterium]MBQ7315951.1 DUF951 domain-containing protein [Clostridia bacterium]